MERQKTSIFGSDRPHRRQDDLIGLIAAALIAGGIVWLVLTGLVFGFGQGSGVGQRAPLPPAREAPGH